MCASPIGSGWGNVSQNCDIGMGIRIIASGNQLRTTLPGPMCDMLHRRVKFIRDGVLGQERS